MPSFSFSVTPANLTRLHDLLQCLSKFDENVFWEASQDGLCLSTLNLSKTAFASFRLNKSTFFLSYQFESDPNFGFTVSASAEKFQCRFLNRALLAAFRKRSTESRDKDTTIERCDVELQARDDNDAKCRLAVRMICRHSVIKTFKLTYEAVEVLRANFDGKSSPNHWTIESRTLKDIVEHFGPRTEQLDWYYEQGKVVFTSYTEKISDGRQILKQPLHTSVAIERKEFDDFSVQEGLHIGIVVKDFKAIVAHADTLYTGVTARYAQGNRPMQLSYQSDGLLCEYTLMTRGHSTGAPNPSNMQTPARDLSVRPSPRQPQRHEPGQANANPAKNMLPPRQISSKKAVNKPSEQRPVQPSPPPAPSASLNHDSLFMPANDDERQWDAPDFDDDDNTGDQLFWDQTQQFGTSSGRRIRDSEPSAVFPSFQTHQEDMAIAPTQRLSGVRGLFD